MLGGNFWIAFLRNTIGAGTIMTVFLMLDRPRVSMKKAFLYYAGFGLLTIITFSIWYFLDWESYIRFAGLPSLPVLGIFCSIISGEGIYLSLYKISLGFYLLSLCVVLGIDLSRWLFEGNLWADIVIRILFIVIVLYFFRKKFRRCFFENVDFLREEMDLFSGITLVMSFIMAAFVAYWPNERNFSVLNMIRIFLIMLLVGLIQYLIFHLYIHLGKENCYKAEKQLLEMNEQLLCRQLENARMEEKEAARLRHDMHHHCLLIREYVKDEDKDKLLAYLKQYGEEIENSRTEHICKNKAVNGILSAYAGYAGNENIKVSIQATVEENLAVRDIDLVAILANIFENAIHGCIRSGALDKKISISITQKYHKIVIQCQNTCGMDIPFQGRLPKKDKGSSLGVFSIMKTASRYDGETDFATKDGVFITRVLLNLKTDRK